MKVSGNISPDVLSISAYPHKPGYVEARIRENIVPIEKNDPVTGFPLTLYEYDEYIFVLENHECLEAEILSNTADWLATGRTLEINDGASAFVTVKEANAEYEAALSEIEAALGVTT